MEFWVVPNAQGLPTVDAAAIVAAGGGAGGGSLQGSARHNNLQSLTTGVPTVIDFESVDFDDASFFDVGGGNPSRITIPAGISRVAISAFFVMRQNAVGDRQIQLLINGSVEIGREHALTIFTPTASEQPQLTFTTGPLAVVPGDFFEIEVLQRSGISLDLFRMNAQVWQLK